MSTKPTTQALTLHNSMPVNTITDLVKAGELLSRSGMFDLNPASGFVVAATCHQQGISLMEFHRSYHIVEGKPSMRADAMLAEYRKKGGKYKIEENSMTRAAATFEFEGQSLKFEYTMEDAKRTGDCYKGKSTEVKHVWQKRPDDMLWARMVSRAVRRLCPEINAGLYSPEEVGDFGDGPAPGAAPVPITPEEAAERATPVEAEIEEVEVEVDGDTGIDFTVCPIGGEGVKGKAWAKFTDAELAKAVTVEHEALTHTHKAAIRFEIDKRKNEAEGGEG